jgi:hypothetical protein
MRPQSTCRTCGRRFSPLRFGECEPCYRYRHRHGVVRPWGAVDKRGRTGAENPNWRGDDAVSVSVHQRTIRLYPVLGMCELCGNALATSRHHWDRTPTNNDPKNIAAVCKSCHAVLHHHGYV